MRDYILLYINGTEHRIKGEQVFLPITDYLRYDKALCGTKVVCAEGDCGACTVLVGRAEDGSNLVYRALNACIQFVYQLDCSHVITVEGLTLDGELNAVQESMVNCHGAQCGYCTPGFVVALCGMFDAHEHVDRALVKEELTGNLCRCTGYEFIVKAALEIDQTKIFRANQQYPAAPYIKAFKEQASNPVLIDSGLRTFFGPTNVGDAVRFKAEHPETVIVAGGTDVSVNMNKRAFAPSVVMCTTQLPGLDQIRTVDGVVEVGARVNLRDLELYMRDLIPEFYKMLWIFGSPQIRSAGTLAGNIANASPIGDTIPFLMVADAEVEVTGVEGSRRINLNQLYKGYKILALKADEIITRIFIPVPEPTDVLKIYKVSRREHLDISTFSAAIRVVKDGNKIKSASIAYGGVGPVVVRLKKTEQFLQGKEFDFQTFASAGKMAKEEVTPISDVRGSSDFRFQLAENIMLKFFYETADERALSCL